MEWLQTCWQVLGTPMAVVGIVGQCLFFSRFLVQWLASERVGHSTVPVVFWYLSFVGGLMLLVYAVSRHDPVIAVGQFVGLFVYARNLILIHRKHPKSME